MLCIGSVLLFLLLHTMHISFSCQGIHGFLFMGKKGECFIVMYNFVELWFLVRYPHGSRLGWGLRLRRSGCWHCWWRAVSSAVGSCAELECRTCFSAYSLGFYGQTLWCGKHGRWLRKLFWYRGGVPGKHGRLSHLCVLFSFHLHGCSSICFSILNSFISSLIPFICDT